MSKDILSKQELTEFIDRISSPNEKCWSKLLRQKKKKKIPKEMQKSEIEWRPKYAVNVG